jgi:adenosyl cobinamide kinase/adenosyl cobinamide phosphate guanylyltransferase
VGLIVLTGGARSGKSALAEQLAASRAAAGRPVTVAVFGHVASGDVEFAERLDRHRASRPAAFDVIEADDSRTWTAEVPADAVLIVDCLGTLLGLAMEEAWAAASGTSGRDGLAQADAGELPEGVARATEDGLAQTVAWLLARAGDTVVVTNEVGDGLVPAYAAGRLFRDALGRANRALILGADCAYLVVAGRALDLYALPQEVRWPDDE